MLMGRKLFLPFLPGQKTGQGNYRSKQTEKFSFIGVFAILGVMISRILSVVFLMCISAVSGAFLLYHINKKDLDPVNCQRVVRGKLTIWTCEMTDSFCHILFKDANSQTMSCVPKVKYNYVGESTDSGPTLRGNRIHDDR
jgi:hypothetical protein